MGCSPLGKMISRALRKCSGKEDHRRRKMEARRVAVCSPPSIITHSRSVSKTVRFSNDHPIIIIPPNPTHHAEPTTCPTPIAAAPAPADTASKAKGHRSGGRSSEARGGAPFGSSRHELVGPAHLYAPSPLPVWDEGPRREYFGGEFNYYPTPIREGIYNIATDTNRLTALFSDENPNACSIS